MNKVILTGVVDKEPEVRYVDRGVCVAHVTLRTTDPGGILPDGTPRPDRHEWHRVVLWRHLGEIVERSVHQGTRMTIEGKLHYNRFTDHAGTSYHRAEIWAEYIEIL